MPSSMSPWALGPGTSSPSHLLTAAFDEARSDNPGRVLAKKVCAVIRDALEPLAPGQVGRYDDSFEVRAFGDNMTRWGTPSVLIETGAWPSRTPDEPLVQLNFVALATALDALASGRAARADVAGGGGDRAAARRAAAGGAGLVDLQHPVRPRARRPVLPLVRAEPVHAGVRRTLLAARGDARLRRGGGGGHAALNRGARSTHWRPSHLLRACDLRA